MRQIINHNIPIDRFPSFLEIEKMIDNIDEDYNTIRWLVSRDKYLMGLFVTVRKDNYVYVKPFIVTQSNKRYASKSLSFSEESYNFTVNQLFTFEELY